MTRPHDETTRHLLIATQNSLELWVAPEWFSDKLRAEFPQLEIVRLTSYSGIEKYLENAEILFSQSLRPEQFALARDLRWIHSPSAAVHQFMFPELVNSGVILTNARVVHGPGVAEHVIALILAIAKRIPASVHFQQKHVWGQEILWNEGNCPLDIAGATLGLVGFGSIGSNVAKFAHAMGMRVVVVREHTAKQRAEFVNDELPSSRLHEMLSQADYVVMSPPLTPATRGMIGKEQLAKMKPSGYLINVGRGPLIDEVALIEALRGRLIAGAALDVFDKEPLAPDSPLWDLDNLLITPHTAGMDARLWERQYKLFSENLRRYFSGQTLLGLVNKHSGY